MLYCYLWSFSVRGNFEVIWYTCLKKEKYIFPKQCNSVQGIMLLPHADFKVLKLEK